VIKNLANYKIGNEYWIEINGAKLHVEVIEKGTKQMRLKINGALGWYSSDILTAIDKKRLPNIITEHPKTDNCVHVDDPAPIEIPVPNNIGKPIVYGRIDINNSPEAEIEVTPVKVKKVEAKPIKDILTTALIDVDQLIKDESVESYCYLAKCFKRDVRFLLNKYGGADTTQKDTIGEVLATLKATLLKR
jgi:hypothetical protein